MAQSSSETVEPMDTVSSRSFVVYGSFGAGLIRNTLSPTVHLQIQYKHKELYSLGLQSTSFFFFNQNTDGDYNVLRNTFAGLEFMLNFSPLSKSDPNWNGIGLSYLVEANGQMFSEPAGMIYYRRKFKYFSLMPGLILDDRAKDVWPVITIRL
jgi:hypothetical protein